MKDYITHVENIENLKIEIEKNQDKFDVVAFIDEDGLVVRTPKAKPKYNGEKSVSICRCTDDEIALVKELNSITVIGEAKEQLIKQESDVIWAAFGKEKYLDVCPLEVTYIDEDGQEQTRTRPDVLVGTLA